MHTSTTTTKSIAYRTGLAVAVLNESARDLGIARFEKSRKSWTVPTASVPALVAHLSA